MEKLLLKFLEECLFSFHASPFLVATGVAVRIWEPEDQQPAKYRLEATLCGTTFDAKRHRRGTEVKAITYSNLSITSSADAGEAHIYVVLDI